MDKNISHLLSRFMAGETSLEEEAWLQRFFDSATEADRPADIPPDDWRVYLEMFAMFAAADTADSTADTSRQPSATTNTGQASRRHIPVVWGRRAIVAAAMVALVMTGGAVWWGMALDTPPQTCTGEVADAVGSHRHDRQQNADTLKNNNAVINGGERQQQTERQPADKEKSPRIKRSEYLLPVEKNLMAMSGKAKAALSDSLENISMSETELDIVMQALYMQQNLQIEVITNNNNTLSSVIYE